LIEPGILVSCQPIKDEKFYDRAFIFRMAQAAIYGGAKGIRIEGLNNIRFISKQSLGTPIIGLTKNKKFSDRSDRIYITKTLYQALKICTSGANVVAIDFTLREGRSKKYYSELVKEINNQHNLVEIWADISTIEEAKNAQDAGVNYISSTLVGYTSQTKHISLPDFSIIENLYKNISIPYFAEGGISSISHIKLAKKFRCHGIVVGTALTRPHLLTKELVKAYEKI